MAKRLSKTEVERYRREGILSPIRVFDEDEITDRLRRLEEIENRKAGRLPPSLNLKLHLLVPWLWDMVQDPRIVDPVEDILGPDVLCWGSSFFAKGANDSHHVPWHQDATYWGLSAPLAVTAWVAFTPSTRENGCLRVIPASHAEQLAHGDTYDSKNMLPGREEILVDVDERAAVDIVLAPGEMSLHHLLLVHGSEPNRAGMRRIGFAIRYIAGHVRQTSERGSATLVRGRDHGHFDLEERPEIELGVAEIRRHSAVLRRCMRIVKSTADHGPGPVVMTQGS
jgi:Phytanoyl-CoA dioxygenase (PhyH)